jgi:hypothetical protein
MLVAELITLLTRVSRPRAHITLEAAGPRLVLAGGGSISVPPAAMSTALQAGFLQPIEPSTPTVIGISPAGRAALRSALAAGAARPNVASNIDRSRRKARQSEGAHGLGPMRPLNRRSVVAQLALRQDARGMPLLSTMHVAAAERFAADFAIGQMHPRVTASWGTDARPEHARRGAPGVGVDISERASAAQARVRGALAALGGMLADLVIEICAFDHGLEAVEAQRGWPRGSGRIVLQAALEHLGRHYGMIVPPRRGSAKMRRWGEEGFRPSADHWTKP